MKALLVFIYTYLLYKGYLEVNCKNLQLFDLLLACAFVYSFLIIIIVKYYNLIKIFQQLTPKAISFINKVFFQMVKTDNSCTKKNLKTILLI